MNAIRRMIFKRRAKRLKTMIHRIDQSMKAVGWSRVKRKQFWHDFIRDESVREEIASFVGRASEIEK